MCGLPESCERNPVCVSGRVRRASGRSENEFNCYMEAILPKGTLRGSSGAIESSGSTQDLSSAGDRETLAQYEQQRSFAIVLSLILVSMYSSQHLDYLAYEVLKSTLHRKFVHKFDSDGASVKPKMASHSHNTLCTFRRASSTLEHPDKINKCDGAIHLSQIPSQERETP
jgi:hypothetical protein